jgi:hypothetical protein
MALLRRRRRHQEAISCCRTQAAWRWLQRRQFIAAAALEQLVGVDPSTSGRCCFLMIQTLLLLS